MTAEGILNPTIAARLEASLDTAALAKLPKPALLRLRRAADLYAAQKHTDDLLGAIQEALLGARSTGEPETGRTALRRAQADLEALPQSSDSDLEQAARILKLLSALDEALVLRISWMANYSQAPTEQP